MKNHFIFIILFVVASCASPSKNFEKGNYEKAYEGFLRDLEKGSNNRKDRNLLNRSFEEMLRQSQTQSELAYRKGQLKDLERLFKDTEDLIMDYTKGKPWLDIDFSNTMKGIIAQQDTLAMDLADAFEDLADENMRSYSQRGDKLLAQQAHFDYIKAAEYGGHSERLDQRIEESLIAATIHILFEADSWDLNLGWTIDNRFQQLEYQSGKFVQVYYEDLVDIVDCHVDIEFNRIDKRENERRTTDNFSKEIIEKYEEYTDSTGTVVKKPIYKTINASVECLIRTMSYNWDARAKINFLNNYCDYSARNFTSQYVLESKRYFIKGDERALPDNMKNLKDQEYAYNENKVVELLLDDIYKQVENHFF